MRYRSCYLASLVVLSSSLEAGADHWRDVWDDPPAPLRPLQIVHGVPPSGATPEALGRWKKLGLGGVVCNVSWNQYLQSETHFKTLSDVVDACDELGLVVWIYDEDGYPSAAAGGRVIEKNRAFEAQELTFDPTDEPLFAVRPAYEHTHASNNFYAARRYPNLIDTAATKCFIETTHERYRAHVGRHFGKTIVAFFTDEPSLMADDLGRLGDAVRKKVRVVDPLDETVKPLPSVPWVHDLPKQYRARYGEDLLPLRRSLFAGDEEKDRRTRRRYWALIGDLMAERFFGQIQTWCRKNGVASGGHFLREEYIIHHVPLYGNMLKCFRRMDVPGMDMLSSDPQAVIGGGWMAAAFPASAALLEGRRRVMTEVSDFIQTLGGQKPVPLASMQATAAWQAAFGVTEFMLYYRPRPDAPDAYPAYGAFVGRLNALLREAALDPDVLLYYPIHDLWSEYLPVAEPLGIASQSPRARTLAASFTTGGQAFVKRQVSFVLADHETLAAAHVDRDVLVIAGRRCTRLVLPEAVVLPADAAEIVERFKKTGGIVVGPTDFDRLPPVATLEPPSPGIIMNRFKRDGRRIIISVNVTEKPYRGRITVDPAGRWEAWMPATGTIEPVDLERDPLLLAPRETRLFVELPEQ